MKKEIVDLQDLIKDEEKNFDIFKTGVDFFLHQLLKTKKERIHLVNNAYFKIDSKEIPVESLYEVRPGHLTSKFLSNESSRKAIEENCLSLIYKDVDHNTGNYEMKSIDMEFYSKQTREDCLRGFKRIIELNDDVKGDIAEISRVWKTFEKDDLKEKDVKKLFEMLNIDVSSKVAGEYFSKYDNNKDKTLQVDEFARMIFEIRERAIIQELYNNNKIKDANGLHKFLKEVQKEEVSLEECNKLINKFKTGPTFDKLSFELFLLSEANDVMDPAKSILHHNLDQPLAHYFIDSSHNTYLSGHQLKGESSIEMYSSALRRGCRCVELDVWDGENEPMIKHGYTLTSRINLRDVCKIIAKHAFVTNPYPVILSIENHTSKGQQDMMANIFKETLGHLLAPPSMLNDRNELPSPNELKNKLLLKGTMFSSNIDEEKLKKMKEKNEKLEKGEKVDDESSEEESSSDEEEEEGGNEVVKQVGESPVLTKKKSFFGIGKLKISRNIKKKESKEEVQKRKKHEKISEALAKQIFLKSVSFKGFDVSTKNKFYEMCSFPEHIIEKNLLKDHSLYNERLLSRIYPKGTRFDSSNYDPIPHWQCNSQIVALNYQTSSVPMKLNRGKFRENGKTGFLLQPKYQKNLKKFPYRKLKISQISGRQLPRSGETSDPYVVITIHGEEKEQKQETSVINNNGFNPSWEDEGPFEFDIEKPYESILLFEVRDKDIYGYKNMAHFSIPVHCIRQGYRVVFLEDANDNKIFKGGANLFCLFEFS